MEKLKTNEIQLKIGKNELIQILEKYDSVMSYDNFGEEINLLECKESLTSDYIEFKREGPLFYFSELDKKLYINTICQGSYNQMYIDDNFLDELSSNSEGDFKIAILDEERHYPFYYGKFEDETFFDDVWEEEWIENDYVKDIIESKELEMDENDEYDQDELYQVLYEVYDELLNNVEILAPDWFKEK